MIPSLFGFPIWRDKIKGRVAKKRLRRWGFGWFLRRSVQRDFARLGVGDFINDCSGNNGRILEITPFYRPYGRGRILVSIDFQTTNTGCSFGSCSTEPKLSQEEIEKRKIAFARDWYLDDSGDPGTAKHWFGSDVERYERGLAFTKKMIAHVESGGHVVDEDGMPINEWCDSSA